MTHATHHRDVQARTPSSAVLVQLLFVIAAVGTGVVAGLAAMLAPKRSETPAPTDAKTPEPRDGE